MQKQHFIEQTINFTNNNKKEKHKSLLPKHQTVRSIKYEMDYIVCFTSLTLILISFLKSKIDFFSECRITKKNSGINYESKMRLQKFFPLKVQCF